MNRTKKKSKYISKPTKKVDLISKNFDINITDTSNEELLKTLKEALKITETSNPFSEWEISANLW